VLERVYPNDDEVIRRITEVEPDIIVAVNWRAWISPKVYGIPKYGTLNVHDALLPAYAGFAPLNWALINGEPEVGVTAHMMNEEFDAGDIVRQVAVPVGDRDTAADLFAKTLPLFETLPLEALSLIEAGRTDFVRQDRSKASYFHRRSIEDSRVDWTWQADELDRLVRAQSGPYPKAFTRSTMASGCGYSRPR
jgi:methionyl-tRNA formyltransferase